MLVQNPVFKSWIKGYGLMDPNNYKKLTTYNKDIHNVVYLHLVIFNIVHIKSYED